MISPPTHRVCFCIMQLAYSIQLLQKALETWAPYMTISWLKAIRWSVLKYRSKTISNHIVYTTVLLIYLTKMSFQILNPFTEIFCWLIHQHTDATILNLQYQYTHCNTTHHNVSIHQLRMIILFVLHYTATPLFHKSLCSPVTSHRVAIFHLNCS